jgi:amino acid transporter
MYSVEIKEDSWESGERNPPASFRSFISRSNGQPGIPVTRSAMTTAIFSYIGMDIVAATAAENKFQGNSESIKMATRKISLRIILLYFFAIVTASFPVAYDDPHLLQTNHGLKSGASSPFMIAIFNAGIPVLPHLLNAFFIFSSSSAGINALYVASRTLHALAVSGRVFDGPIARRLKLTVFGVPMVAVFTSSSFGLLAFMSTKAQPSKVATKPILHTRGYPHPCTTSKSSD